MTIICGPDTRTISYSNQLICGRLIKISNIEPYYQTIEILIDNQQIIGGIGNVSVALAPDFTKRATISLLSKNVYANTANISFAIETIEIPPPPIEVPTHMVQLELSPNQYISQIEQNILSISAETAKYIPFDPDVKYIRTELDSSKRYMNVYLKYVGPAVMSLQDPITEIVNFIKIYLIPALIVALGVFLALAILSTATVITIPIIIIAASAAAASFITAWIVRDLLAQRLVNQETIDNQDAFIQAIASRDSMKKAADEIFAKSNKSAEDCTALLIGYQEADKKYIDTLKKLLPKVQLDDALVNYKGISNTLISDFQSGKISCDQARAGFAPAENALYVNTNEEFNKNYDPDAKLEKCPTDCFICEPITNKCILSKGTVTLIGLGLLGFVYMTRSSPQSIIIQERRLEEKKGG